MVSVFFLKIKSGHVDAHFRRLSTNNKLKCLCRLHMAAKRVGEMAACAYVGSKLLFVCDNS